MSILFFAERSETACIFLAIRHYRWHVLVQKRTARYGARTHPATPPLAPVRACPPAHRPRRVQHSKLIGPFYVPFLTHTRQLLRLSSYAFQVGCSFKLRPPFWIPFSFLRHLDAAAREQHLPQSFRSIQTS